ncbi:MAG: hypothetical protein K5931_04575 [Lachnospiraceae bacterium]|nr:hypothetical protein [Lachnospiraceae bacterium]
MNYKTRRRIKRQANRTFKRFLMLPAKMPRLGKSTFYLMHRVCEFSGTVLVIMLILSLVSADHTAKLASALSLAIFAVSFFVMSIKIYQDKLVLRGLMS